MTSLYEHLGGVDALQAATANFVTRAGKDERINRKFARTDLSRLTKEFVDFLCSATGGPCSYTGRTMKEAHASMGVTNGEFDAFMEIFGKILDGFQAPTTDQREVVSLLMPLRPEIVEVNSVEIGTPLPSTFNPAPALIR